MPLGGSTILWTEGTPAETDIADAAPIRSIETSIRNAMGSEHNWPSTGGANVGYHLLGSARPFFDVQSNVSSTGTDGRLLVTSDTSRLFHVGSAGTMFVGGVTAISAGSQPVGGQRFYWAMEMGLSANQVNMPGQVTFPNSGYSGVPFVVVSLYTPNAGATGGMASLAAVNATGFTWFGFSSNGNFANNSQVFWMSLGTRTF